MKSYTETLREARRLTVLRLLNEQPGYRSNSSVLAMGLEHYALDVSRDELLSHLHWLAEQGLVSLEEVGPVTVATLTARGCDAAEGRAVVPGVRRPSPR